MLRGPGTFMPQDVQLDGSGEARGFFTIFSFGPYNLGASFGGVPPILLTLPLVVDAGEVPCP